MICPIELLLKCAPTNDATQMCQLLLAALQVTNVGQQWAAECSLDYIRGLVRIVLQWRSLHTAKHAHD
jgi:hypothetical protein